MSKSPPNNDDAPSGPFLLFCDGASRGNPGPASYGFIIFQSGEIVFQKGGCLGITTNNVAEYEGLVRGLDRCVQMGASEIVVKSDSELLVRQLSGRYRVKAPQLLPLFERAKQLLKQFKSFEVVHIPRAENSLADALANEALDNSKK
jgi:ribonuclease HI